MASIRRTYFLAPSWTIRPEEVPLGSVVASPTSPHKPLSATSLLKSIDTQIPEPIEEHRCQGILKSESKWSLGLLSTFIKFEVIGPNISLVSNSIDCLEYTCDTIETRRFVPSLAYITTASKDPSVKGFLDAGGFSASVYMITGVKTASKLAIHTIMQNQSRTQANTTLGFRSSMLPAVLGPGVSYSPTKDEQHRRTIEGPVVFAFEIEKIRVGIRGKITHAGYTTGAMLGHKCINTHYEICPTGSNLDENELDAFGLTLIPGIDDESRDVCDIIVPNRCE